MPGAELTTTDKLYIVRRVLVESTPGLIVYLSMLQVVLQSVSVGVEASGVDMTNIDVGIDNIAFKSGPISDLNSDKANNACNATYVTLIFAFLTPLGLYIYWAWQFITKEPDLVDKHDFAFCFYLMNKRSVRNIKLLRAFIMVISFAAIVFAIFDSGYAGDIIPEVYTSIILVFISFKGILRPYEVCPDYAGYKKVTLESGPEGADLIKKYESKPPILVYEKIPMFPFVNIQFNLTGADSTIKASTNDLNFAEMVKKLEKAKGSSASV